jgi:hypothetical protein
MRWRCKALLAMIAGFAAASVLTALKFEGLFQGCLDHPAIQYATRPVRNPVSELNRELQERKIHLTLDGPAGYLRSALDALKIPVQSQMVVFSKTSLMQAIINPSNPRTIFFNDSVAVAWVRGEPFVELAAEDPGQGVIFYVLDQKPIETPQFRRIDGCLQCHESYNSLGVPGMLVRSVHPASNGAPMRALGDFISDHRSPFEERWGGWYVTGKSGALQHMGNLMFNSNAEPIAKAPEIDSLDGKFDLSSYLSPYSDIVALMVFEHQMHMTNLFTRAGWETRSILYDEHFKASGTNGTHQDLATFLDEAATELVDYILFIDEAPLHGRVRGTSGFSEEFAARGPQDSKGRSLRQFDLERRLMRYPCSYMIYSEAFDRLPAELKEALYGRMWQILSGEDQSAKYARLSDSDRRAVVEILRATKIGVPDYFQPIKH